MKGLLFCMNITVKYKEIYLKTWWLKAPFYRNVRVAFLKQCFCENLLCMLGWEPTVCIVLSRWGRSQCQWIQLTWRLWHSSRTLLCMLTTHSSPATISNHKTSLFGIGLYFFLCVILVLSVILNSCSIKDYSTWNDCKYGLMCCSLHYLCVTMCVTQTAAC